MQIYMYYTVDLYIIIYERDSSSSMSPGADLFTSSVKQTMDDSIRYKNAKVIFVFVIVLFLAYTILGQNYKMFIPSFNSLEENKVFLHKFFVSSKCSCSTGICHQFNISDLNQNIFPKIQTIPVRNECALRQKSVSCLKRAGFECVHYMKLLTSGRTGNLMFQVAALFGTATKLGYTAIVSPSNPLKQFFTLPNLSFIKTINNSTFRELSPRKYDKRVDDLARSSNWTLKGYYQSWRYFEGMEGIIRKVFKFKGNIVSKVKGFINHFTRKRIQSVCIHVRRGDFAHNEAERKRGHVSAPVSFISKAMQFLRIKHKQVHFFVLSDDKEWCKNNLTFTNMTISPFDSPGYDMALMAYCDHVIITAGTFGWWGGWLSRGDVVYWTGYPRKGSSLENETNLNDYYPNDWIGIP